MREAGRELDVLLDTQDADQVVVGGRAVPYLLRPRVAVQRLPVGVDLGTVCTTHGKRHHRVGIAREDGGQGESCSGLRPINVVRCSWAPGSVHAHAAGARSGCAGETNRKVVQVYA